jgi:hypothetical protein
MGNMAYLFNDYLKDLTSGVSITNQDNDFTISNLLDPQIALTCRTTAKVAIKLQIDLGSSKQIKAFFIGNHNFSGGTFDINSYTANDFTTGKITVESAKAIRLRDVYHREASAPASRRYWEFDFTNATSDDSFFQIGRVMMYDDFTLLTNVPPDIVASVEDGYNNIINTTPFGIKWAHVKSGPTVVYRFQSARKFLSDNMIVDFRTLMNAVQGGGNPFVFIPDLVTVNTTDVYYVRMQDRPSWAEEGEDGWEKATGINFELTEESRGLDLG